MNLSQLRAFVAVAHRSNFSEAALHVPAVFTFLETLKQFDLRSLGCWFMHKGSGAFCPNVMKVIFNAETPAWAE